MNPESFVNNPYEEEPGLEGKNTRKGQELHGLELEQGDKIEEALVSIETLSNSNDSIDAANALWEEHYREDPSSFWEQESMAYLKTLTPGERVQLLKRASRFAQASPADTFLYTQTFPEDVSAFGLLLVEEGGPRTSFELKVASLFAPDLEKSHDGMVGRAKWFRQMKEIYERRTLAQDALLYPEEFYLGDKMRADFPQLENEYFAVMSKAADIEVNGNERLSVAEMFGANFDGLDIKEKMVFLRSSIARLHNMLVESETYNSAFTKESVQRLRGFKGHNPAHSMLFKTRQPSKVYEYAQENFEYEMNNTASWGGAVEEYPFHRMLLASVRKITELAPSLKEGNTEDLEGEIAATTELVVNLWDKNRNPIFANAVSECLTALDATYASQLLLDKVKNEKVDKTALAAILYRLEFGKIGISKDGVRYLERMYDLGDFNNPDFFVNRLTARGEMGIFDRQNRLVKYFHLENFDDENREQVIQPAVLDFAYETLFVAKENETEQEREERLAFLEEFKQSYFGFYDDKFLDRTGVRFNNLTFKEQGSFLLFNKTADESQKEEVLDFAKVHGEKGIRLFLMMNQKSNEFGQQLMRLSQSLDERTVEAVTTTLSDILLRLDDVSEFVQNDPKLALAIKDRLPEIQRKIISRALVVLESVLEETEDDDKDTEEIALRIFKKLSTLNADAVLLASTLTTVRHMDIDRLKDPASFIDGFSDTGLFDYEGYEFSSRDLGQIRSMYDANYADNPAMRDKLYDGFLKKIEEGRTEYSVVKYRDEVVAICGFEHLDDGGIYFGKFNIEQAYQGAELGNEMMENTLDRYATRHIIRADCNIEAAVSSNYIERGFVAIREYEFEGTTSLEIVRNESANNMLESKEWTADYITEQAKDIEDVAEGERCVIRSCEVSRLKDAPLDLLEQVEGDGSRYVLSRFVRQKKGEAAGSEPKAFLVFEKLGMEEYEDYMHKFKKGIIEDSWVTIV